MPDTKITTDRNSSNMEIQQHKVNTSLENVKKMSLTNNPKLVPLASLRMVHLVRIIYQRGMTDIPITGRLSQLLKQCKKVTWDKVILSLVKGYRTPFIRMVHLVRIIYQRNNRHTSYRKAISAFKAV